MDHDLVDGLVLLRAEAVELHLMQPGFPARRTWAQDWLTGLDEQ
jgi:hypothetical protein